MDSISLSSAPGSGAADSATIRRALHAAHEFEAILLNTLLKPLEHGFAALPGKEPADGSDNYQDLSVQALASGLAARGGLGIADMIARSLLRGQSDATPSGETKVSSPSDDRPR